MSMDKGLAHSHPAKTDRKGGGNLGPRSQVSLALQARSQLTLGLWIPWHPGMVKPGHGPRNSF